MSKLSPDLVLYMLQHGWRQVDIAAEFGVSRQYVNKLAKLGGRVSPITTVGENFPWDVDPAHRMGTLYHGLRLIGHAQLEGVNKLNGTSLVKARAILKKLIQFNQVIDYNSQYDPIPGLNSSPGFAYVARTESDGRYLIKLSERVILTELGEKLWRFPLPDALTRDWSLTPPQDEE